MNTFLNSKYFKYIWELLIVILVNLLMIVIFKSSPNHGFYL